MSQKCQKNQKNRGGVRLHRAGDSSGSMRWRLGGNKNKAHKDRGNRPEAHMNAVEIEEAISALAQKLFDAELRRLTSLLVYQLKSNHRQPRGNAA